MWNYNKTVLRTHCKYPTKVAYALINGIAGWKQIRPTSTDGVTNIFLILSAARANNRAVDVYIKDNFIEQATLR